MASEDDSQGLDTHHDEKDWEAQKENFRICYIDNNMTRKEAAEYMKEHFNFNATPRQWERKIKQWNFSKYTGREDRLAQIAQAGKTVFDVSRPGRRARSHVDDRGNLQPHEDRNLRRFARREVSRSRSRSRSASFVDTPRPQFKSEFSDPGAGVMMNTPFDFNEIDSEMQRTPGRDGYQLPVTATSIEQSQTFQPQLFQAQSSGAYGAGEHSSIALPVDPEQWAQTQAGGAQQFTTTGPQGQYNAFQSSPMPSHASPPRGLRNASQSFSGTTNNPPFAFPIQAPSMSELPAGFNQYMMPANDMGVHPGMLPEDLMTEQTMFGNAMQLPQSSGALDQRDFDNQPMITFDLVDMDSATMLPPSDTGHLQNQAEMVAPSLELSFSDDGPLRNDVLPLLDHYTRTVQAVALGAVTGPTHGNSLAADLIQPSKYYYLIMGIRLIRVLLARAFMTSMAVFLNNYTKTQQRSLQSIRDTCSKLRQKNAMLEQVLNSSESLLRFECRYFGTAADS